MEHHDEITLDREARVEPMIADLERDEHLRAVLDFPTWPNDRAIPGVVTAVWDYEVPGDVLWRTGDGREIPLHAMTPEHRANTFEMLAEWTGGYRKLLGTPLGRALVTVGVENVHGVPAVGDSTVCDDCDYDTHVCGGCGEWLYHGTGICGHCKLEYADEDEDC